MMSDGSIIPLINSAVNVSGAGGVIRQLYKVAPEECFHQEKLLFVRSGDEKEQKLLEERARLICGVEVAPL